MIRYAEIIARVRLRRKLLKIRKNLAKQRAELIKLDLGYCSGVVLSGIEYVERLIEGLDGA